MCGVGVDDLAPVWVEVGLGGRQHRDRADAVRLPDEPHLRFGQLLAGVADHDQRIRVGQQSQRRRQVRLPVAAHARGVDECQPTLQQRAGRGDLDTQHFAVAGLRRPAQVGVDVVDRDVDGSGFAVRSGGHDQPGRRWVAVADDGDDHGRLVVAHPRDRQVEQRVE